MKSILAAVDDIDTRREVLRCFQILPAMERVSFLLFCCDKLGPVGITNGELVYLTIKNDTQEPMESFLDFWMMVSQYGMNLSIALPELERRARQFTRPKGIEVVP